MTPLRQRMVEDMRVRNLSANTQRAYLQQVGAFAKHFGRSPATLGPEEIRAWQLHLVEVRQLARSSLVTATAALRFLYTVIWIARDARNGWCTPRNRSAGRSRYSATWGVTRIASPSRTIA
jgi:site-specific recombinase XerD